MMINDEKKKNFRIALRGRALYIALGVCVLGAGAVSLSTLNMPEPVKTETITTEKHTYININDPIFHQDVPELSTVEEVIETVPPEPVYHWEEPSTAAVFDNNSPNLESTTAEEEMPCFTLPVNGKMGKDYSMGAPVFSSTMSDYRSHNGIDIVCDTGVAVKASAPGTVMSVVSDSVWGNCVEIDHGAGYVTKICGLADEGLIAEGSVVDSESILGVIGSIPVESKDGSHIHFEIRKNDILQDPLEVLGFTQTED